MLCIWDTIKISQSQSNRETCEHGTWHSGSEELYTNDKVSSWMKGTCCVSHTTWKGCGVKTKHIIISLLKHTFAGKHLHQYKLCCSWFTFSYKYSLSGINSKWKVPPPRWTVSLNYIATTFIKGTISFYKIFNLLSLFQCNWRPIIYNPPQLSYINLGSSLI